MKFLFGIMLITPLMLLAQRPGVPAKGGKKNYKIIIITAIVSSGLVYLMMSKNKNR